VSPEDAARVAELRALLGQFRGDLGSAVAALAGVGSVAEFASRLELPRQTVQQAFRKRTKSTRHRRYPHVYRAAEAELRLPPFALDAFVSEKRHA
jgi:AraC-like DNA-binding protein